MQNGGNGTPSTPAALSMMSAARSAVHQNDLLPGLQRGADLVLIGLWQRICVPAHGVRRTTAVLGNGAWAIARSMWAEKVE
jgi:hypothetical protein